MRLRNWLARTRIRSLVTDSDTKMAIKQSKTQTCGALDLRSERVVARSVRAWWVLPRDVARSYLGRSPADEPEDHHPVRCCHTASSSSLSTSNRSHRHMPVCIACSWWRRWSDSHMTRSTAADIPEHGILK